VTPAIQAPLWQSFSANGYANLTWPLVTSFLERVV